MAFRSYMSNYRQFWMHLSVQIWESYLLVLFRCSKEGSTWWFTMVCYWYWPDRRVQECWRMQTKLPNQYVPDAWNKLPNWYLSKAIFLVCRPSSLKTCNVHGTIQCPSNEVPDQCTCAPEYAGEHCQRCKENCMVVDNTFKEGEVDVASGEGVICSCECFCKLP